jgi:hypothetical protein
LSPLLLVVLGLATAAIIAAAVFAVTWFFRPAKAARATLAALIGGTVGFATTALVQAPFYMDASAAAPVTPMVISVLGSALMALLAAAMILRTPPRPP